MLPCVQLQLQLQLQSTDQVIHLFVITLTILENYYSTDKNTAILP